MGVSRDFPIFWVPPYYLRNGKSYEFQVWPLHLHGPSEQKPIKILVKGSVGVSRDCRNFFGYPPIISGTGKATNFKFCTHIHGINRKKPIKVTGKVAVGVVRDSRSFFRALIYRAHRAVIFAIAQLARTGRLLYSGITFLSLLTAV